MMNEIKIFNNGDFGAVRGTIINGEVYFVGMDIAKALGYKNISRDIQRHCKDIKKRYIDSPNKSGDNLTQRRGVLMITESDVYRLVSRSNLLAVETKESVLNTLKELGLCEDISLHSRDEIEFRDCLEEALLPFDLDVITQHNVLGYRTDFYIPKLNITIEYDEDSHKYYNKEKEKQRESDIKRELKCEIIRINNTKSHSYNCGLVLKQIMKNKEMF